jgi:hypothetical protein
MSVFKYCDEKQFLLCKYHFYSLLMSTVYHLFLDNPYFLSVFIVAFRHYFFAKTIFVGALQSCYTLRFRIQYRVLRLTNSRVFYKNCGKILFYAIIIPKIDKLVFNCFAVLLRDQVYSDQILFNNEYNI